MPDPTPTPKPRSKRPKRATENADYVAMVARMIRGLETRAQADPSILAEVTRLVVRVAEIPNVVIAVSSARHLDNPRSAPSAGEIAAVLDISKQAASDRAKRGERTLFERSMGEGILTTAERRQRTIDERERVAAVLADWLARKESNA